MLLNRLPPLPALGTLPRPSALPLPPAPIQLAKKLPMLLARNAGRLPFGLQRTVLLKTMEQAFKEPLEDGDFEFLEGKWMKVEISDINLCWFFSYEDEQLIVSDNEIENAGIRGNLKEFILLASRQEDPDTLFFQRRLMIEGDTEVGLEVKNLMDGVDHDGFPPLLKLIITRGSGLANKLF
ncbi:MAG: SCP2 sterol-binding domain-containing protein [Motiliproteus sp.]|nr:SCP2 sterol-binding domain-containing protein [Motiliproteus sp.]MCW9053699.1 SCP2 sterol-binding domain-containing protein [Motiliproteus sp.]